MSTPLDRVRSSGPSPYAPRFRCDLGRPKPSGAASGFHELIALPEFRQRSAIAPSMSMDDGPQINVTPQVFPAPRHRTKLCVFVRCSLAIALMAIAIPYVTTSFPGTGFVAVAVASDRRDETPSFDSRWTDRPIRQLDRREITDLIRRGNELIIRGDLASARLVLQRAAEAGDPQAALVLAGTYDPVMLVKVGIQGFARDIVEGFAPDAALARRWYQWAKELGSMEAVQRLEMLPDPGSSTRAR